MDALSDILSLARVEGSLFSRAALSAPWGVHTQGAPVAIFHAVLEGSGFVTPEGGEPEPWSAGDLIVLPHGHPHVMSDRERGPTRPISQLPAPAGEDGLACLQHGGGGATTRLLCGTFRMETEARELLLPLLPPAMVVRADTSAGAAGMSAWLDATLRMIADEAEAGRPGAQTVIARLADVLFVQVLRAWLTAHPETPWLGALTDPHLARALDALHRDPAAPWTAERMARRAGLSRSAFFTRFVDRVGEPPGAYLLRWRMQIARSALRREDVGLAELARRVGYGSEAAFSRAFKRSVGASPSAWRRAARAA